MNRLKLFVCLVIMAAGISCTSRTVSPLSTSWFERETDPRCFEARMERWFILLDEYQRKGYELHQADLLAKAKIDSELSGCPVAAKTSSSLAKARK